MPTSKKRRKKSQKPRRQSVAVTSECQPRQWREPQSRSNFQSLPRQVEKKYWRQ